MGLRQIRRGQSHARKHHSQTPVLTKARCIPMLSEHYEEGKHLQEARSRRKGDERRENGAFSAVIGQCRLEFLGCRCWTGMDDLLPMLSQS